MTNPIKLLLLLFAIYTPYTYAQNRIIIGVVTDTLNKPIDFANIMAIPQNEGAKMQYAITEETGKYTLEVDARYSYDLTLSYMGYHSQTKRVEPNDGIKTINFKLIPQDNQLDEIIIDYDYQPIVVKKDTVIYNLNSFVNGNERKLKDALEKLPGVEVQKNGDVTVQGKKVTQLHVEGKKFFGGGSKLAVENIPADAVEKVEVIDNFVEVDFLKKVSSSEDLAMNIKLKEDKKKFVFGDIEAGAEIANDNEFYVANAALFYYSPKTSVNFIADMNTIGKRIFSYADLRRFEGGVSSFITGRKSISNLAAFSSENKDVKENKAQFVAASLNLSLSKKIDVTSYGIFSKIFLKNQSETSIEYIQPNQNSIFEFRSSTSTQKSTLGLWNTKLDWTPNKKNKIFYNFNLKLGSEKYNQNLETISILNPNDFSIKNITTETDFKQYLEWHQDIQKNWVSTFVVNHTYNHNKPENTWISTQPFLQSYLPIQNANQTHIEQVLGDKQQNLDVLLKNYWILSPFKQLYFNLGNNYTSNSYQSKTFQILDNQSEFLFNGQGFYNALKYSLNDFYLGLEFKFYIGKLINTPGIYWHQYSGKANQTTHTYFGKGVWLPQWISEYEFKKGKKLRINYNMQTAFATASQMAEGKILSSYSSVYKGNALQSNEVYHQLRASLSKFSLYRGFTYFLMANYVKKDNSRRNEINFDGINRFTTTVLTNLPEQRAAFSGSLSKNISEVNAEINSNISWNEYYQSIDQIYNKYNRNSQSIGISARTLFDSIPEVRLNYNRTFNQLHAKETTKYATDNITVSVNYNFLKHYIIDASYEKFINHSAFSTASGYEILNASLRYQKKNKPWTFEIMAQNILGNKEKITNSITDYMITETKYYILSRNVMAIVRYKL